MNTKIFDVEYTDEFAKWWNSLTDREQVAVDTYVQLLEVHGPSLDYPHSSQVKGSRNAMRELRVQCGGKPLRILYVFDPRRCAILLCGGDKTGDGRWYKRMIPEADHLYDQHIKELGEQGLLSLK